MRKMNGNQRSGEAKLTVVEASAESLYVPDNLEMWKSAFSGGWVTGRAETGTGRALKKNDQKETILPRDSFR